jgi:hypothetical protein
MAWTPGPWRVGPYDPDAGAYHLHPYLVESGYEDVEAYDPDEGNARLIAAAPEMADLLADVSEMLSDDGPDPYLTWRTGDRDPWAAFRECRALLRRIRGEA